jgi:hypothetical protein
MGIPISLKLRLVRIRDRLPMWLQRGVHRIVFLTLLPKTERELWDQRLADALSCRDNAYLPRHPDAGVVRGGVMTMHNGVRIHAGSYYGWGSHRILEANKGCHEPQEERAFAQVLEHVKPGGTMIELGAYWSFYSLWFATEVVDAKNWMVEPEEGNMEKGKANFALNGKKGRFIRGYVGKEHCPDGPIPQISVDGLMTEHGLMHVEILHCDIQGYEEEMLFGATNAFEKRLIDYVFISTHSNKLHVDCCEWLKMKGYLIHQEIDLDASFSHDGLIVAVSPDLPSLPYQELDRRTRN